MIGFFLPGMDLHAQEKVVPDAVVTNSDFSELTLSKSFRGESIETLKKVSIGLNISLLKFHLTGMVKNGTITVSILKPNGTLSRTVTIDPTSDFDFKQTIDVKKNIADATGDWQIKIQTDKAEGYYRLIINTR